MKEYRIASNLYIRGETLKDAIETDFPRIANLLQLGNVAGYRLHEVWCEYNPAKRAVDLHVIASGSDLLVNYDPSVDVPKEKTVTIDATEEDCPQCIDFELVGKKAEFTPFDDACLSTPSGYYGTLLGIIDEVALHHCKIPSQNEVTCLVACKYPTLSTTAPLKHVEYCRAQLTRLRPKTDKETTKLMERISELAAKVLDFPNDRFESSFIAKSKTAMYFRTNGKTTALSKIRSEKGLTQKQVAEAAQMSVRQLQNYEKCPGSTLSSASKYVPERLAKALGVPLSAIVDKYGDAVLVER